MKNNFESGERPLISDDTAIEALKSNNMEVFEAWLDQLQNELDAVYESSGPEAFARESLESAIKKSAVYYKSGYVEQAIADLRDTVDAAQSKQFEETDLAERSLNLLDKMLKGNL